MIASPSLRRHREQFQVRGRTSGYIDKVQRFGLQHLFCRGISSRSGGPGSFNREITRRHQFDICYASPGLHMIPGEEPTSDQATLEYLHSLAASR